ncbi:restriction endonuclease [Synechococcus moorigangaii CMS01]|nr:restriction endonuclease [Synechococcus moorigangaii CMS01]
MFDIWGLGAEHPSGIIGECKNYKGAVGRDVIEKFCWRVSKGNQLGFIIANKYTDDACKEVGYINLNKQSILIKHEGVYVILITLGMIDLIVTNNVNFCYFIRWGIQLSKNMEISNYIQKN